MLDVSPYSDIVCHLKVTTAMNKAKQREGTPARRVAGQRDREETRKGILAAMGRVLARKGSKGLGINAIAREAKVDKVLIYRYFGGLDELYRAFALEGDTFPHLEELAEGRIAELPQLPPAALAKLLILGFGRAIRRRPVTREIMRWELQERNALTDEMSKERERQSQQWFSLAPELLGADLAAVASILAAGQVYLTLKGKTTDHYNGIELNSKEGWKRIESAVALLCDLFFADATANAKKNSAGKPGSTAKKVQR
jgi:AcrR family transcriptional regulator